MQGAVGEVHMVLTITNPGEREPCLRALDEKIKVAR